MNIPPPMDSKTYRKSFTKLYRVYRKVASQSMQNATEAVVGIPDETGMPWLVSMAHGNPKRCC